MPSIDSICKFNRKKCDFSVLRLWTGAYQPNVSFRNGIVSLRFSCSDA